MKPVIKTAALCTMCISLIFMVIAQVRTSDALLAASSKRLYTVLADRNWAEVSVPQKLVENNKFSMGGTYFDFFENGNKYTYKYQGGWEIAGMWKHEVWKYRLNSGDYGNLKVKYGKLYLELYSGGATKPTEILLAE